MADTKISGMTPAGGLTGAEVVPILQGGANVITTAADIAALNTVKSTGAIYIDKSGNDGTGTGTIEHPYLTITKGISVATAAQLIVVGVGTFTENLWVNRYVNIIGASKEQTIIVGFTQVPGDGGGNGTISFTNIQFKNTDDYAILMDGGAASVVCSLYNCRVFSYWTVAGSPGGVSLTTSKSAIKVLQGVFKMENSYVEVNSTGDSYAGNMTSAIWTSGSDYVVATIFNCSFLVYAHSAKQDVVFLFDNNTHVGGLLSITNCNLQIWGGGTGADSIIKVFSCKSATTLLLASNINVLIASCSTAYISYADAGCTCTHDLIGGALVPQSVTTLYSGVELGGGSMDIMNWYIEWDDVPLFIGDVNTQLTMDNGTLALSDGVQMGLTPSIATLDHKAGRMYWDAVYKTMAVQLTDNDVTLQVGQEEHTYVQNISGGNLVCGDVVYVADTDGGGLPAVKKAQADSDGTSFVLGLVTSALIANNEYGYVTSRGHVSAVNTAAWAVGDSLYLSGTTAGSLTNLLPASPFYDVRVGKVMVTNGDTPPTGKIFVNLRLETKLTDIADVTVVSPVLDEVLKYNGAQWVNGPGVTNSASNGVMFYMDAVNKIPLLTNQNVNLVDTMRKTPVTTAEHSHISVLPGAGTTLANAFLYDAALGITKIDAGEWSFSTYCFGSTATNRGQQFTRQIYRVLIPAGTISITGTGTTRTATANGGLTPFLAAGASATNTVASYLETPKGLYQIITYTSASEVSISTPTNYTNETTVAYGIWRKLFGISTGLFAAISSTSNMLISQQSSQAEFTFTTTDKLGEIVFAVCTNSIDTTFIFNGTNRYTHFRTPMVTLHNTLAGVFGSAEGYHISASDYAGTGLFQPLKIIETNVSLLDHVWSLVGGVYEIDHANVNITENSIVNITPDVASMAAVLTAVIYPKTTCSAGSVKLYAKNAPTADITVTVEIFK